MSETTSDPKLERERALNGLLALMQRRKAPSARQNFISPLYLAPMFIYKFRSLM